MCLNRKDSRMFWKSSNKLGNTKTDDTFISNISTESWTNHSKNILRDKEELSYPPNFDDIGILGYDITFEEVKLPW